jgi:HEAT repeats
MNKTLATTTILSLLTACDTEPPPRTIPELVESLLAADHLGRQELAVELRSHGTAAVPAWIQLLENPAGDYNLHVVAASELGALGADAGAAVPVLARFLREGFSGMKPGEMSLDQRIKTPDVSRQSARTALQAIGVPAVEALRALLRDASGRVRQEAATTLGGIGPGAAAAVPDLIRALGDADKAVAIFAAWSLGELLVTAPTVQEALVAALQDAEALVRFEAARALGKFGEDAAGVREDIRKLTGDPHASVRRIALEVLGRLPVTESSNAGAEKSTGGPPGKK